MKRLLIILFFSLFALNVNGQTFGDFKNAWSYEEIGYDENFTPILKLTFKNVSDKTITTIELKTNYNGYDPYDLNAPICSRTIKVNIAPKDTKTLTIKLDKDPYGNKPKSFWLTRIRYVDGSICDK